MEQANRPGGAEVAEFIVQRGTPCVSCEYDLSGLPASGTCPECAAPVAVTLDVGLTRQPVSTLSRAISGAVLLLVFLAVGPLMLLVVAALGQRMWEELLQENEPAAIRTLLLGAVVGIGFACYPLIAIRRFTTAMSPAAPGRLDAPRWRAAARVASVLLIALTLVQIPVDYLHTRSIAGLMNSDNPNALYQDPGSTLIYYLQFFLAMLALGVYTTMLVGVAAHARSIFARAGRTRPERSATLIGRALLVIAAIVAVMNVIAAYVFQFTTPGLVTAMMSVYAVIGIASIVVGIGWIVMIGRTLGTLRRAKRTILLSAPA